MYGAKEEYYSTFFMVHRFKFFNIFATHWEKNISDSSIHKIMCIKRSIPHPPLTKASILWSIFLCSWSHRTSMKLFRVHNKIYGFFVAFTTTNIQLAWVYVYFMKIKHINIRLCNCVLCHKQQQTDENIRFLRGFSLPLECSCVIVYVEELPICLYLQYTV